MAGQLVPAEMVAFYGADRLRANRDLIDPVAWERIVPGLEASAHDYLRLVALHRDLVRRGVPALDLQFHFQLADLLGERRLRQCGVSLPLPADEPGALPAGLQLVCAPGADRALLATGMAIEQVIGPGDAPDLSGFC